MRNRFIIKYTTMENIENKEIQISTERLQRETVSMKYIQEIFKEFTDDVTKRLRASTPKAIEEEYARVERSIEKLKQWTDVNFTVVDKQGCKHLYDLARRR